jgi:hypothetical protein
LSERASCKINFSFSPSFSLGLGATRKVVNRFNGLNRNTRIFLKPLKRFGDSLRALIPRLKPGENEKLDFARCSEKQELKHARERVTVENSNAILLPIFVNVES